MSRGRSVERTDRADAVADAGVGAALGYSRPGSYEELRAVLSSGTARLPKKLRQVAIHLWQHPTAVALGTVTSVAGEAGVQPSTLVRFAQAFGYTGFSDLQEVFKAHLADGGRGGRDQWEEASSSEAARLVDGFIRSSATSLAGVRDRLDLAQFEAMSQTLAGADLIYIIGSKRAFSLVSYVSLALANLGVRNLALDNVGSTAFELLRCASASDAVLAVSFTPYNSITPELAASAAQRGVPIVSHDRQRVQSAGSGFEGLYRGDRRKLFRVQVAFGDVGGGDGAGAARRTAASRSGLAHAESARPRRVGIGPGARKAGRRLIGASAPQPFGRILRCANGGSSA